MIEMTSSFPKAYPDAPEGMATEPLARVATILEDHMGTKMDDETRLSVLLELQRIERDDLPEDLQQFHDTMCSGVEMD